MDIKVIMPLYTKSLKILENKNLGNQISLLVWALLKLSSFNLNWQKSSIQLHPTMKHHTHVLGTLYIAGGSAEI